MRQGKNLLCGGPTAPERLCGLLVSGLWEVYENRTMQAGFFSPLSIGGCSPTLYLYRAGWFRYLILIFQKWFYGFCYVLEATTSGRLPSSGKVW